MKLLKNDSHKSINYKIFLKYRAVLKDKKMVIAGILTFSPELQRVVLHVVHTINVLLAVPRAFSV